MCSRHTTRVPHLFHEDSWTNWMILSKQVEYQPASCLTPGGEQENPKSLIHLHINTASTVTGGITQIKWWVICKHERNSFFFKLNNDYNFRGRSFFVSAVCLAAVTTCRGSFSYLLRQRPPCSFTWKSTGQQLTLYIIIHSLCIFLFHLYQNHTEKNMQQMYKRSFKEQKVTAVPVTWWPFNVPSTLYSLRQIIWPWCYG